MKKVLLIFTAIVSLLTLPSDARPFVVKMVGDTLSVHAEKVPLQDILHRLTKLGIRVQISPQINPEISVSFEKREIQRGLETIVRPYSQALIWETIEGPLVTGVRLAEIQVYETGKRALIEQLDTGTAGKTVL